MARTDEDPELPGSLTDFQRLHTAVKEWLPDLDPAIMPLVAVGLLLSEGLDTLAESLEDLLDDHVGRPSPRPSEPPDEEAPDLDEELLSLPRDPVACLYELAVQRELGRPRFIPRQTGNLKAPEFTTTCTVPRVHGEATGKGRNKAEAKKAAARAFLLERLNVTL